MSFFRSSILVDFAGATQKIANIILKIVAEFSTDAGNCDENSVD